MSGLELKYFVLRPKSKYQDDQYAFASRQALRTYADSIAGVNGELAHDIRVWVQTEDENNAKMEYSEPDERL